MDTWAHKHAHTRAHTHAHTRAHTHAHTWAHKHAHTWAHKHAHMGTYTRKHARTHRNTHTHRKSVCGGRAHLNPRPSDLWSGSGVLLFIFHANFLSDITARLCGPCSVHAVVLNDKFQLPIFLVRHASYPQCNTHIVHYLLPVSSDVHC